LIDSNLYVRRTNNPALTVIQADLAQKRTLIHSLPDLAAGSFEDAASKSVQSSRKCQKRRIQEDILRRVD
jgi:hypothetical protein